MVEISINRGFCENVKKSLEEPIIDYVKGFIKFTQPDEMIQNVNNWYESCGSKLWYKKSNGKDSYLETTCVFSNYNRKFVRDTIINYIESTKDSKKYYVAIPAGNGKYITILRSANGTLCLNDREYISIDTIKRHNSNVPGGITMEEINNSEIFWCKMFMEELNV